MVNRKEEQRLFSYNERKMYGGIFISPAKVTINWPIEAKVLSIFIPNVLFVELRANTIP